MSFGFGAEKQRQGRRSHDAAREQCPLPGGLLLERVPVGAGVSHRRFGLRDLLGARAGLEAGQVRLSGLERRLRSLDLLRAASRLHQGQLGSRRVQVRLRAEGLQGYESVPALPVAAVLAVGERRAMARLYRIEPGTGTLGVAMEAVPGPPDPLPDGRLYRLPFSGVPVRIDQGYDGRFSHQDPANRYALDFALPEGTPVLAAREGTVLQVEGDFGEHGERRAGGRANLVRILHRDGTMAIYAHLAPSGLAVRPGQWVQAGQRLSLSGQTGLSTAPHLHFAIQVNAGLRLAAIPFRIAGPLGELRFSHEDTAPAPAAAP